MMTLEKANESLKLAKEAFDFVQKSANADRKLHEKHGHPSGHWTKALQELQHAVTQAETQVKRAGV